MGTGGSFPRNKSAGPWGWPFTSISADVRNERSYNSTPITCLHGVYRDNCTLLFTRNWSPRMKLINLTLKMEAERTSEISVNVYQITRCNIPEDCMFHSCNARTSNTISWMWVVIFSKIQWMAACLRQPIKRHETLKFCVLGLGDEDSERCSGLMYRHDNAVYQATAGSRRRKHVTSSGLMYYVYSLKETFNCN
jgi:hypothetical protein